jgi:hypothetical protein
VHGCTFNQLRSVHGGGLLCRLCESNASDRGTCPFPAPWVAAAIALANGPPLRFAPALDPFEIQAVVCTPYEILVPEQPTPKGNVEPHLRISVLRGETLATSERQSQKTDSPMLASGTRR